MGDPEQKIAEDNEEPLFQEVINLKKTGGITIPKNIRAELFPKNLENIFFKLIVPKEKNKIILEIIEGEEAKKLAAELKIKKKTERKASPRVPKAAGTKTKDAGPQPDFSKYFIYEFEAQEKLRPILESAFYKFGETPVNLEDAMGRIKYGLVQYLGSKNIENARLYLAIVNFLCDVIEQFNLPNLIEWIDDKIINSMKSKFLYEQALLSLVVISIKANRFEKGEQFASKILENIDTYPKSELYNIMNSFENLVNAVSKERSDLRIIELIKDKLISYLEGIEDIDYKVQIVEILEDLRYIEEAYDIAKNILANLPPESSRIEFMREIVKRLHIKPIE